LVDAHLLQADVKKPVVVFVRDQLARDADCCRYSPGGASLTDSGRGNSDCEQSTPSMSSTSAKTSPRHDVNSKWRTVNNHKVQINKFVIFHPFPHGRICTKFHAAADIITCRKFLAIVQGVWIPWVVENCHFLLTRPVTAALPVIRLLC